MLPSPGIRWWIYRSDFEEMGFFFMPTLVEGKKRLGKPPRSSPLVLNARKRTVFCAVD
jgi:hypothetical protein